MYSLLRRVRLSQAMADLRAVSQWIRQNQQIHTHRKYSMFLHPILVWTLLCASLLSTITPRTLASSPHAPDDVTIVNDRLPTAYHKQNASSGPWELTSAMNSGRWRFAGVAAGNYLYALGGNGRDSSITLSSVERAAINADGSLDPWQFTTSLSVARGSHAAVAVDGYIYTLGGSLVCLDRI